MSRLQELMQEIRALEERVATEISREAKEFGYTIRNGRIAFSNELLEQHRAGAKRIRRYFSECSWIALAVAPVVYSLIIPVVLFDLFIWVYQATCFPIYRLPKVRRSDYIVIDQHHLKYLNVIERFNCVYCSYANGFLGYAQEVAARSEQYWCPIKHARRMKGAHSRYAGFVAYGDADAYVKEVKLLRQQLHDMIDKES